MLNLSISTNRVIIFLNSDHVIVRFRMRKTETVPKQKNQNPSRFVWKTDDVNWDLFQSNLESIFEERWHEKSNDVNVLWELWKSNINSAAKSVVKRVPIVKNYRDFWDKSLDRFLKSRRDANRLQRLHNKTRPHDSELGRHFSDIYKKRKLALQEAIKRKESQRKMKFLSTNNSGSNSNSKRFWQLLRGSRDDFNPSRIIDPNNKNEYLEDVDDIRMSLNSHFSKIGSDCTVKPDFKNYINRVIDEIDAKRGIGDNIPSVTFTAESISDTLRGLKSGKAPGVDGIPNDILKYGGDAMIRSLSDLFTFISDCEQIPNEWQRGIIIPLHKSGSVYDLDNYRGITLSSNVYKLFSKTLETHIVWYLESNNILGDSQGAFRKDRRIEDHIFSLQGICALSRSSKKPLYLAFLDLSKAFDRVWRDGLFAKLWQSGIQGKVWRLVKDIYKNVENKVLFGDIESTWFEQEYGVKQ